MAMAIPQTQTDVALALAISELLSGKLSDQTIHMLAAIERKDVPAPLDHLLSFIQGAGTEPDKKWLIPAALREIIGIARETLEKLP